jgi:6-pyruvoyltetrahydropterin/6-carboxytetrahydropterin synthase
MMFEVSVETRFEAAHQVRLDGGQFEPLHTHQWRAEARWVGPKLDGMEVLVDFVASKQALERAVADMNGRTLNEVPALQEMNPSAEQVARLVYARLADRWPPPVRLAWVRVEEAVGCSAIYHP